MRCFVLSALPLALAACSSDGPVLVAEPRPAIAPTEVRVYAEPPAEYETIALLSGSEGGGNRSQALIEEFRAEAASVGANGVLLERYEDRGWRARPGGYASTFASNYGSGFGLGFGLSMKAPQVRGEARAIWVEGR